MVFLFPFFWSVQWQVSLNKAEIYGRKGEHPDSDFPLAASHDSTYVRSFECSCQLYKSTSRPRRPSPCSALFSPRSHRYPEQHDKNNNALFTGQYIVTVQSSLAVDLRSPGFLSVRPTRQRQKKGKKPKSAPSWKQSLTALQSEFLWPVSNCRKGDDITRWTVTTVQIEGFASLSSSQ